MKSFRTYIPEGTVTSGMIKSLGFLLRNKLSNKIKEGKSSRDTNEKLDALLDAKGILGSLAIFNIGMKDKGSSLMSRSNIILGLINELYEALSHSSIQASLFDLIITGSICKAFGISKDLYASGKLLILVTGYIMLVEGIIDWKSSVSINSKNFFANDLLLDDFSIPANSIVI